ncbi:hypothetical protein BJF90_30655 [Pseudonocardia sp. CNS-004]|nr:hypothetical protein BJF90_30655 [Pseudonocardia sp. CNS-004]
MTSTGTSTGVGRPDLSDLGFWTEPIAQRAAAFATLREREPVPFYPEPDIGLPRGPGFWALTKLDDLVEASRNAAVFTSGKGSTNVVDQPPEFREFYGSMINMDDPRHARLRRIVSRGFTPRRLGLLTDEVERTARSIVDEVIDRGECDAVSAISARLPLKIVCDMMGVPASQYRFVFDRTNIILGPNDPEYVAESDNIIAALLSAGHDLAELMRDLGRHRVANPTDDVTSAWSTRRSTASGSPPTSSRASSSCSSRPAPKPPATRSAGACTCSPSTPSSGPCGWPTSTASCPRRWRRSSGGRPR